MKCASHADLRSLKPFRGQCWSTVRPVTVAEVEKAMKGLKDGAPGPDRVDQSMLKGVSGDNLATHMHLWLLCECPPKAFHGVTTWFQKALTPNSQPGDFRPITVASIIPHLFHRGLALRLEDTIPLSSRQKAFRCGDGLCDNVCILWGILCDRTRRHKPVFATFVDMAKAFDSVSHDSMIMAAGRAGVPVELRNYISRLYSGTSTRFKVGSELSDMVHVRRGVRPLSPRLIT